MRRYHVCLIAFAAFVAGSWFGAAVIGYLVRQQRIEAGTYRPAETIVVPWKIEPSPFKEPT